MILGEVGVIGETGSEGVEGVNNRSAEGSAGAVFHRNNDTKVAPGDFKLLIVLSAG